MACRRSASSWSGTGSKRGLPSGANSCISLLLTSLWVMPNSALPCWRVWYASLVS